MVIMMVDLTVVNNLTRLPLFLLSYLNMLKFNPHEVLSRCRDPHPQVGEHYISLFNLRLSISKSPCLKDNHFIDNNSYLIGL